MLNELLSFALVAGVLTIIPGLDTTLVLRSTLAVSKRAGFITGFGIVCGLLVWAIFVALGLNAVLSAWDSALTYLRVAACLYLAYLGFKLLLSTMNPKSEPQAQTRSDAREMKVSFSRGFLTNALNPKIAVFYVTMLPQFYPHDVSHIVGGLILAGIHGVESLLWFAVIISLAARLQDWFANPRNLRALDTVVAMILFGFAIHLAMTPIG